MNEAASNKNEKENLRIHLSGFRYAVSIFVFLLQPENSKKKYKFNTDMCDETFFCCICMRSAILCISMIAKDRVCHCVELPLACYIIHKRNKTKQKKKAKKYNKILYKLQWKISTGIYTKCYFSYKLTESIEIANNVIRSTNNNTVEPFDRAHM